MFDSYVGLRGPLAPVTIAWVIPPIDVQVFAPPSCCYVFDLVGTQRAALLRQLQPVLEDPSILKVFHDCRQDSAALKYQAGIRLQHVLDTQVTSPFYCTHLLLQFGWSVGGNHQFDAKEGSQLIV